MMKQITADLKRLVKADPGKFYSVKIRATNKDIDVGFQYNGDGMYRALQIDPNTQKAIAMTGWTNSVPMLERAVAHAGLKLAEQRPTVPPHKSIYLYVDGQDMGLDMVDVALARNMTVDDLEHELKRHFAPAQVQFKVEVR